MKVLPALLLCSAMSFAGAIDVNGDFEKCTASATGIILPEGWIINQGVSKNAEVYITREPDYVRNGFFALHLEVEEGGTMYLMKFQNGIEAKPGDRVEFSIWGSGKGKVALGFIQNAARKGKSGIFLGTVMLPGKELSGSEDWVQHRFVYELQKKEKDKVQYEYFSLIPVIYVQNKADILLDDMTMEMFPAERTSEK